MARYEQVAQVTRVVQVVSEVGIFATGIPFTAMVVITVMRWGAAYFWMALGAFVWLLSSSVAAWLLANFIRITIDMANDVGRIVHANCREK